MFNARLHRSIIKLIFACSVLAVTASAASVTLTLDSPEHETVVQPGDVIYWSITFTVSTGDNEGLALISVDLEHPVVNPAGCCLELGDYVPEEMDNFSRPYGISNRGEQTHWTGYVGTRENAQGGCNLVQIGGAQNTFSEPGPLMGWNTDPDTGIGQGAEPQLLLEGSFEAPETDGTYMLGLSNIIVNVLDDYDAVNERWNVVQATGGSTQDYFSFIICEGDVDGDAAVGLSDIAAINAVHGSCLGDAAYDPTCDLDDSGCIDGDDTQIVIDNYSHVCN